MSRIWYVYDKEFEKNKKVPMFMVDTAKAKGIKCSLKFDHYFKIINNKLIYNNKEIKILPKVCFFRANNIVIAKFLEVNGVKVVNSFKTIYNAKNKFAAYKILQKHKVLQPKSILYNKQTFQQIKSKFNCPFVLKDNCGKRGVGVYLINNAQEFDTALNEMLDKNNILVQEYIKNSKGKDLRFYIINNKIYGCIIRYNENDFRSNTAQGGKVKQYFATKQEELLALNIANLLKLEVGSVDFLIDGKKLLFCEANTNATFEHFLDLGIQLNQYIVDYLSFCNKNSV